MQAEKRIMRILITGAAGNLGTLLARHLAGHAPHALRLMIHRRDVEADLRDSPRVEVVRADLADPASLAPAVAGVEVIVHFAGVLFKARPERFLPETNTRYFENLVDAARAAGVGRIILISFPHVEGPTSRDRPAAGRLDGAPVSVHAQTRLQEECYLFQQSPGSISLRVGMVYGRGILMIDAARWLAARRLLGVWRERTQIHLIAREDFCSAAAAAIEHPAARGIYQLGDDGNDSLQEFLDLACDAWGVPRPWRMPLWLIRAAAAACECWSAVWGTRSPLTRDFIAIGRVPYYGDTSGMKRDLLPRLRYPTIAEGRVTL